MSRLDDLRQMRDFIDREIEAELVPILPLGNGTPVVLRVAALYGVTTEDIFGDSRRHQVCRARQGLAWLLRRQGMSHPDIARTLGYGHHSTSMHAVRKIEADGAAKALLLGLERAS